MDNRKTVLVTGGARGIGLEISKLLIKQGYNVIIHCNESTEAAKSLCGAHENASYIKADLSASDGINALCEKFEDVDILINNAGLSLVVPFDAADEERLKALYSVNLFAPITLTRKILPKLIHKKSGVIINVSSIFGEKGGSCEVDYSVTKAALIGFTKALAKEVGPAGIRVNCVCPGVIDTDMNDDLTFEDVEALTDEIPLCRMGKAEEVAKTIAFLISDDASYITGSVFDVNGGWD